LEDYKIFFHNFFWIDRDTIIIVVGKEKDPLSKYSRNSKTKKIELIPISFDVSIYKQGGAVSKIKLYYVS